MGLYFQRTRGARKSRQNRCPAGAFGLCCRRERPAERYVARHRGTEGYLRAAQCRTPDAQRYGSRSGLLQSLFENGAGNADDRSGEFPGGFSGCGEQRDADERQAEHERHLSRFDGDGSRGTPLCAHRPEPAPQSRPCRSCRRGQEHDARKPPRNGSCLRPGGRKHGCRCRVCEQPRKRHDRREYDELYRRHLVLHPAAHRCAESSLPETGAQHRRYGLHAARLHQQRGARREYGQ